MSRLRLNDVLGSASGNPITLTSGTTTTCSWSSSPAFPLISPPDLAVIVVEPDTTNEEILYLRGFTPGATTGLVTRAAEPNQGGSQVGITHTAVAWIHGPTAYDLRQPATRVYARGAFR